MYTFVLFRLETSDNKQCIRLHLDKHLGKVEKNRESSRREGIKVFLVWNQSAAECGSERRYRHGHRRKRTRSLYNERLCVYYLSIFLLAEKTAAALLTFRAQPREQWAPSGEEWRTVWKLLVKSIPEFFRSLRLLYFEIGRASCRERV